MSDKRMNAGEFAAEVERLLWTIQDPTPDLAENLGLIETLLEDYDASTRAHLALAEAVLKSTVWADHDELSQNLLWTFYTLHDQGSLRLGVSLPSVPRRRATLRENRMARAGAGEAGAEENGSEESGSEKDGGVGVKLHELEPSQDARTTRATAARAGDEDGDAPD